ncbi:MAG: proton-conducting transporter membrane subunit, partial [bacterium]
MLLTFIIFIPLLGAGFVALLPRGNDRLIRDSALATALVDLLLCIVLICVFQYGREGFDPDLAESHAWVPALGISYSLNIDGLSLVLVVLTCLLSAVSVLCSFSSITDRVKEYYFLLLLLETGMLGTFLSSDLFLFFVFWELMLVPMYFLIGVWGHEQRIYASIKFFL